jgi:hypothetical protein
MGSSSITAQTKRELVIELRARYALSSRHEKARILDEFTSISGYHRKSATRLLHGTGSSWSTRLYSGGTGRAIAAHELAVPAARSGRRQWIGANRRAAAALLAVAEYQGNAV